MNAPETENFLASSRTLLFVAAFMAVVALTTNLPWQLDDYDQAKQAFTSFEMVKEGHWLYQRTPHERIATKPPLVGWISAALFQVTRSWNVAWRAPSLGAAAALAFLLYRAARFYGGAAALTAMAAFGFNLLTPRLSTLVRTDMPLALAIFAIGLMVWRQLRFAAPWTRHDRLIFFLLLSAAMLIKGPIVYAFLLPGLLAFQCWRRKTEWSSAWAGWWPWLASLCLFLIWVGCGSRFIPGFYDQVVVREFLGRFGETIHRPQPLYFYLPHLLHKFAPWSFLVPGLAAFELFNRRKLDRISRSGLAGHVTRPSNIAPETAWLICWAVGGLALMSIIPSKRVDRIFPVVPPLCLLLAAQLRSASLSRWRENSAQGTAQHIWRLAAITLLVAIVYTAGYSALKIFVGYRDHRDALVRFAESVRERSVRFHWRYEIIDSKDEGLLLYLDKLHFVRPERAAEQWARDEVDALIMPAEPEVAASVFQPNEHVSVALESIRAPARGQYLLITR
jgi:4-amino-4-deoxy-L-arabinose transferase-like glycosyltransferase